jgi:GH24 family phage-related lysozyme (muramidase)
MNASPDALEKQSKKAQARELNTLAPTHPAPAPRSRRRRRERVRQTIRKLRERRLGRNRSPVEQNARTSRPRKRKRKAAMALSVGFMGFSSAAMSIPPTSGTVPVKKVRKIEMRMPAQTMSVSEDMKEALIEEEGVRLTVYRDVAGYPTVGVGHLVRPGDGLSVGDRISHDMALDFLEADLVHAEQAVARLVKDLPLYQHEFDALVDLVYNVGEGNVSERKSPRLNAAIAAGDYAAMAEELNYTRAGSKTPRGLAIRSERRAAIFMNASYDNPRLADTAA